ncbi:DNA alkylation repair protein [Portibacter marinus]|uniref:DNA alkylation repair protein n=1 Tax=Portibacter marinus TaxID=2898660 RepID=UPI001F2C7F3D|nr:DNA alkylation repair protein [Portibacter marinus]
MTVEEVMTQLESWGNPQTKKVLMNHGAREPFYGVKVADLKKIVKKVKKDHELAMALYETGNSDAMYLAALISDESKMTKSDLQKWAEGAYWYMISEYSVAWAAAESPYAEELADEWIESEQENIASAGWATWSNIVLLKPDDELDLDKLRRLMSRAEENIHDREDRVSYAKNNFILAVGGSVKALTKEAMAAGKRIGKVKVNMGETACKVPFIPQYLQKMADKGKIGYKKKTVKC